MSAPDRPALLDFADDILLLLRKPSVRADVVPLYATALLYEMYARPQQAQTRWGMVNEAIAERWSWSAVTWIKKQAWKQAEKRVKVLVEQQDQFDREVAE